ncbi:hypothetical protein ACJIZ3_021405 [Penstemon smallii]|uniref:Uncharacterized protein n=1 Tax=Penstemon smallii TaxID=265156 RepID=A0ABD3SLV6_9LAMI
MPVVLERNGSGRDPRIERPVFVKSSVVCVPSIYKATDRMLDQDDRNGSLSPSSSSSSIGKNSDDSGVGGGDEEEVQSEYKGGPLDSLNSLEEVLPIKRSISKFYCGKSKSFTSLSDAATCSSMKDITKPENAYTRKRKNLLAFDNLLDKNRNSITRGSSGGKPKRPTNSRSMLSLAATMNCSESNSGETSNSNSSSPGCCLPPLPPHAKKALHHELPPVPPVEKFPSFRSFSLSDLQGAAAAAVDAPSDTSLWIDTSEK